MLNKKVLFSFCLIALSVIFSACPDFPKCDPVMGLSSDEFNFVFNDGNMECKKSEDVPVTYKLKLDSYANEISDVYVSLYKKDDDGNMVAVDDFSFEMNNGELNNEKYFQVMNKKETGEEKHLKFNFSETGSYELKIELFSYKSSSNLNYINLSGDSFFCFEVTE